MFPQVQIFGMRGHHGNSLILDLYQGKERNLSQCGLPMCDCRECLFQGGQ